MTVSVRRFRVEDALACAELMYAAVHQIARQHYSEAQVRAWVPQVPEAERIAGWAADGRLFLVATDAEDQPLAFADLEMDGHIDHLFCAPKVAGTGVTSVLYDRLEAEATGRQIKLLYVEASEPARQFFLRRGFVVDHRRDFEVCGVPIHNYRMEKPLGNCLSFRQ